MTIRIHNLSKWLKLEPGNVLQFRGEEDDYTAPHRLITVEVNCVEPTRFDVLEGKRSGTSRLTFLAVVQGYAKLEFSASADAELVPSSDGEVWFATNDGDSISVENDMAVSFTTVMNRRARNPELERIAWKMEQNMNRRLSEMAGEVAAFKADFIAKNGYDPETGEVPADDSDGTAAVAAAVPADQGKPAGDPPSEPAASGVAAKPAKAAAGVSS